MPAFEAINGQIQSAHDQKAGCNQANKCKGQPIIGIHLGAVVPFTFFSTK
jgi:hypothetical protein